MNLLNLNKKKVILIEAHPYDIEFGSGALIKVMLEKGCELTLIICSKGEKKASSDIRLNEQLNAVNFLKNLSKNVSLRCLNFKDTQLLADTCFLVKEIEKIINKINPDLIITHSQNDKHLDHEAVFKSTLAASHKSKASIICYTGPRVGNKFNPNFLLPVNQKMYNFKMELIYNFESQVNNRIIKKISTIMNYFTPYSFVTKKIEYCEPYEIIIMK